MMKQKSTFKDSYKKFNKDVIDFGGYIYTNNKKKALY